MGGISDEEKLFWKNFSVDELHSLYLSLSATAEKVLNIMMGAYTGACTVQLILDPCAQARKSMGKNLSGLIRLFLSIFFLFLACPGKNHVRPPC